MLTRTALLMAPLALLLASGAPAVAQSAPARAPAPTLVLVPKYLGPAFAGPDRISTLFDQARAGAEQAAQDLNNPSPLQFTGPTAAGAPVITQLEAVTSATAQGAGAIMISNNSGDDIVPAIRAAHAKGIKVVSWDSPLPAGAGEDVYIRQVDFAQGGQALADMARDILPNGGALAVLVNAPGDSGPGAWTKAFEALLGQPRYADLKQVDRAYSDNDVGVGYRQTLALLDKHPDLKLIVAPDSNSILGAAKAIHDAKRGNTVKVTGFGLPREMGDYVREGVVPRFALWSFVDFGYLAYYTAFLLATDTIKPQAGQQFTAGRLGPYTITRDPARPNALLLTLGPWAVYDKTTIASAEFAAGRAEDQADPVFGIKIPTGYRDWKLISVAREEGKLDDLRAVLGNDLAIDAYRAGKQEFPDGAIIARLAWAYTPSEESNKVFGQRQSYVAGPPKEGVQFMVKDSKKYASTGGWGFAQFYDGKPADEAVIKACFTCHVPAKGHDFVFTHYAP